MKIPPSAQASRPASRGVALVVTLMMMSVLVMMVVGLAGVMRNEQAAARNLTYMTLADQLAQMGVRQGMSEVLATSITNGVSATGPGWALTNGVIRYLFPTNPAAGTKNLEEIGTNSLVFSLPDGVRGEIRTGWSNIVPPNGNATRPVGRFTFWVDDEGSKVNLNAAGSNNASSYLPLLTNFPFSANYLFADPATGQTNAAAAARSRAVATRTNFFPSPESLKDTNVMGNLGANSVNGPAYRRVKGGVTAWSSNADLTPWGSQKINLLDPTLTSAQIKAALTNSNWVTFLGPNVNLGRKYGGGSIAQGSHGDLVLDQIAMNILALQGRPTNQTNVPRPQPFDDPRRHRNGLPVSNSSLYAGPYLEEVRFRVDGLITTNLGTSPLNYTVDAQLSILVKLVNPYPQVFSNYALTLQPRKFRFGVATARPPADSDFVRSNAGPPLNDANVGPVSRDTNTLLWYAGPEWYNQTVVPWPLGSGFSTNNLTINARSRLALVPVFTQRISVTLTNQPTGISSAYLILDSVILRSNSTPPLVRDWVTCDDFSQQGNYFYGAGDQDNGQMTFGTAVGIPILMAANGQLPVLGEIDFTATTSRGLRKVDPQSRFSFSYWDATGTNRGVLKAGGWPNNASSPRAWTINMVQTFTNTGLAALPADPVPANLSDLLDHPHFVQGYRPTNGLKSPSQLGAIHTGLPWRTLRFQPTPAAELAQGPPDWTVLDVFSVTSSTVVRPMLNLNGIPMALRGGQPGPTTNANGSTNTRPWGLLAAMGATTTNPPTSLTNTLASNGVPLSLVTNSAAAMTNLLAVATNFSAALTQPSQAPGWSTNSGWPGARTRSVFPAHGFALRGEILEVRGVAEDNTPAALGEDVIEGRTRAFLDLLTTRSDTFSVWSVGQALAYNTNRSTAPVVMGEVRRQTVVQRVPGFDANGNVTGYELRVLYTRNHTVE